ncbi:hypothetical protein Scep_019899 [Stephania cephalantha]|uniref:Uncharacterized protein n=1 Tax=Stephania cephalantha TaxID=152367 RepID=A0AAP0IC20_9MAGN
MAPGSQQGTNRVSRNSSNVNSGIVCKKNVAHRRMTSKIEKARLLILGGALEYQRVSNHLSSFDTLFAKQILKDPNILLVEKSVSRYAQEYLLAKDISLVLNIKRPLLDRIARCTGAQIVPSIDHISSSKLGYCEMFHVEKFLEEHGSTGRDGKKLVKTLMFFEGCPKPLGCTLLFNIKLASLVEPKLQSSSTNVLYETSSAYENISCKAFLACTIYPSLKNPPIRAAGGNFESEGHSPPKALQEFEHLSKKKSIKNYLQENVSYNCLSDFVPVVKGIVSNIGLTFIQAIGNSLMQGKMVKLN